MIKTSFTDSVYVAIKGYAQDTMLGPPPSSAICKTYNLKHISYPRFASVPHRVQRC